MGNLQNLKGKNGKNVVLPKNFDPLIESWNEISSKYEEEMRGLSKSMNQTSDANQKSQNQNLKIPNAPTQKNIILGQNNFNLQSTNGTTVPTRDLNNRPKPYSKTPKYQSSLPQIDPTQTHAQLAREMKEGYMAPVSSQSVISDGHFVPKTASQTNYNVANPAGIGPTDTQSMETTTTQLDLASISRNIPQNPERLDIDQKSASNNDTPLTLACDNGHLETVKVLLERGANKEHRDKKGFTPLILAATSGHLAICQELINRGADIEASSDRTKDTALSLACSSGRKDVVEYLLKANADKEHRNVSDYTPLALAASGGYVDIIKILLDHDTEINSRTNSKLGISPLMLASMNGHVEAVKLLLDRDADINAQIETNSNTALTLACFQGRAEVVKLLVNFNANVEHRAKTGLTPLMEAASGGYAEVGQVLIEALADVNASPVASSRDTALTISADKGHRDFCELLLKNGGNVDARNKRGNTPMWLAANGGHLEVIKLLFDEDCDVNMPDNRGVTPLIATMKKGHIECCRWLISEAQCELPSAQECTKHIEAVNIDASIPKKTKTRAKECLQMIACVRQKQEEESNKKADDFLAELEREEQEKNQSKAKKKKKNDKKKEKKLAIKKQQEEEERKIQEKLLAQARKAEAKRKKRRRTNSKKKL